MPVWALSGYGGSLVVPRVPWLLPPAANDVGARFLEHTLLLNDVLMGLVLRLRAGRSAPLAALPFQWLSEDDGVLEFEKYERTTHKTYQSVLKPDAVVDVRRRALLRAAAPPPLRPEDHGAPLRPPAPGLHGSRGEPPPVRSRAPRAEKLGTPLV